MFESKPKKENFELKKEKFYFFCKKYIDDIYNETDGQPLSHFQLGSDFFEEKIDTFFENGSQNNLDKKKEFIEIFIKVFKDKSKEIFFAKNYDKEKEHAFHSYFYNNFFSMSPNLTSYLNSDFFAYTKLQGDLMHSGVLDYVNQAMSGEMVLSLHDIDINSLCEKIENISISQKILFIKTLGDSARRALASGDWSYDAYKKINSFFENFSQKENVPLLDYILKYQLSLMRESEARFHDLYLDENLASFREERINFFNEVYSEDVALSEKIHLNQRESVFHKNLKLTSISKDYVALVNGIDTSVALVKHGEKNISSYKEITKDKAELVSLLHSPEITCLINNEFNIDVRNMYLNEQVQFLSYLSSIKNEKWKRLEAILKNKDIKKEYMLRSFLSLDKGGKEMGENILNIAEKLPVESTDAIFDKYVSLVNITEEFIESEQEIDFNSFREFLLKRGVSWLKSFSQKNITEKQLIRKLENSKLEILVKGQIIKYLNKNTYNFDLENFSDNFEIQVKNNFDLNEEELKEHLELYEVLRDHYDLHSKKETLRYYKEKLQKKNQTLLDIYDHEENKLVGSIRVGELENGNLEIASLMVDYPYEHIDLGSIIFEKAVYMFSDRTLEGRVLKGKEWLLDYYARFGFTVAEEINDHGIPAYRIIREPGSIEH